MTDIFSCIEMKSTLSAYFDEELSLKEKAIVEEHLAKCSKCREELENIKKVSFTIKDFAQKTASLCPDLNVAETITSRLDICNDISEDLSAFIDKELPKDRIVKICEHLLQCEYCRADYEDLKLTQNSIKNYFEQYTEKIEILDNTYNENIVNKTVYIQKQKRFVYSAAIFLLLTAITYFSFNFINPNKKINLHYANFIDKDKPTHVESESYLFSSVYSEPVKEVLLLIYEN